MFGSRPPERLVFFAKKPPRPWPVLRVVPDL
jgi:hypothetical protein